MSIFNSSLFMNSAASGFGVSGVTYNGTTTANRRGADWTGDTDTTTGTLSTWILLSGGDGANLQIVCNIGQFFYLRRNLANVFELAGTSGAVAPVLTVFSNNSYTASSTWHNVCTAWDLTAGVVYMYIDDVSDIAASPVIVNSAINYSRGNWSLGDNTASSQFFNGAMAETFFHNTFLDISITANRRKFISVDKKPVNLGPTGALPLGVQPLLYASVRKPSGVVGDWNTQLGSGGSLTLSGTQALSSTSPSD